MRISTRPCPSFNRAVKPASGISQSLGTIRRLRESFVMRITAGSPEPAHVSALPAIAF